LTARGTGSIHLFVFALADFFELGEAGGFGSVIEFGLRTPKGWGDDTFSYRGSALWARGQLGVMNGLHGLKSVDAIWAGVLGIHSCVVLNRHTIDFLGAMRR